MPAAMPTSDGCKGLRYAGGRHTVISVNDYDMPVCL